MHSITDSRHDYMQAKLTIDRPVSELSTVSATDPRPQGAQYVAYRSLNRFCTAVKSKTMIAKVFGGQSGWDLYSRGSGMWRKAGGFATARLVSQSKTVILTKTKLQMEKRRSTK